MKLLFVVDPLASLKPYKDSSVAMMRAACARGHAVFAAEARALLVRDGVARSRADAVETRGDDDWYRVTETREFALTDFDAVVMRADPPVDVDYLLATHLLGVAETNGARVLNRPRALRDFNEKLAILEFPQFVAPTLVSADATEIAHFLAAHADIIVKPLTEMGGSGVFRLGVSDPNRNAILETLTRRGSRPIMAQRYLPAISEGDKRILLIDGEVVPWALARIPLTGETRGNLAAGGTARAQPLSERDREIAETIAPWVRSQGIFLAGLDVIGDCLTEINVTSPTGFQEITAQSGHDVADQFIAAIERATRPE
ncbi:glutathione synthetase [Thiobacillus denitrificans ATCC 25259]|uniref:Glutathione synthetase n=1 Tax=Thiobacillus denitrificans (strain ATCC 25259 / T1) TaxID=292415 RepID=Q3SG88_THIDA|nr:glutathione synthase [Thiobacillus denitrificans]AAZ98362.1 glutathione synthetase [Thiobacillus denitrificans ATCC 25259]